MRVKGLMPPEDGLSRETPTALGHFYRNYPVTEKSRMFYGIDANRTSSILCFRLGIIGDISSPLYPLVSAIATWQFLIRQGKG